MVVDGHGCHTALHFGVKAKENQNKKSIKQDLLLILVLVRQQNFLNCKIHVLQLLKNVLLNTMQRYMKDPVRIYFGQLNCK